MVKTLAATALALRNSRRDARLDPLMAGTPSQEVTFPLPPPFVQRYLNGLIVLSGSMTARKRPLIRSCISRPLPIWQLRAQSLCGMKDRAEVPSLRLRVPSRRLLPIIRDTLHGSHELVQRGRPAGCLGPASARLGTTHAVANGGPDHRLAF